MKSPLYELDKLSSLVPRLTLTAMLMMLTSASFADGPDLAYVDSVHKWGAWGLDIEPAAGGLSQLTTQALNARDSKVALRTNSISALAPGRGAIPATPATPTAPGVPATPAIPATPTITPINPSVPIPVGGPAIPGGGPGA